MAGGQFFGDRGFAFAGGHGEKTSSGDKVMTRAAEILDWDSAVLVSAMKQAKQEPEEERFASIEPELTALVESGDLSQEEADAKLEATLVGADKAKATKKIWATKEEGGTTKSRLLLEPPGAV